MFKANYSKVRSEIGDEQLRLVAPSIFAAGAMQGVSNRYTFLPTSQIIASMRQEGWAPVHAEEQRVRAEGRRGWQKHVVNFQRRGQVAVRGEYAVEVVLVNSHDRSSAYQLHAGLYRVACANGLLVADSTFEHISIRHSGFETREVLDASFRVLEQLPRLTASVEAFRARTLTPAESHAFAESAIMLRWDDLQTAPVSAAKVLWPRRTEDAGSDLWSVFNRIQENLTKGGMKDYTRRKEDGHRFARTRAVTGLDENVRLNKSLWHLAEALRRGELPGAQN
ncbi:MAG: DUF932 domain-containing protein [Comamonadaceae bacterium]|jgi:Domain of unknown function (DUF932)